MMGQLTSTRGTLRTARRRVDRRKVTETGQQKQPNYKQIRKRIRKLVAAHLQCRLLHVLRKSSTDTRYQSKNHFQNLSSKIMKLHNLLRRKKAVCPQKQSPRVLLGFKSLKKSFELYRLRLDNQKKGAINDLFSADHPHLMYRGRIASGMAYYDMLTLSTKKTLKPQCTRT